MRPFEKIPVILKVLHWLKRHGFPLQKAGCGDIITGYLIDYDYGRTILRFYFLKFLALFYEHKEKIVPQMRFEDNSKIGFQSKWH